ncbi:phosphotransferase [Tahibacter caeni]|uniref:phosphotransferase n=1 Tax=Tahibacter caeni TaxID=1453545 RepID=UPI002148637C|nr:phosphotransferase [Tahibacter caeni]
MLDKSQWSALIPHQGTMCLLDTVVDWNGERIHARSASHARGDNPLRQDGRLRSLHLCEYGAQAMAVHGGLLARAAGGRAAPGLLVSLRDVELSRAYVDDLAGELDVHAERLLAGEQSWQYAFRVEHAGVLIARGRAAVMVQPA